MSLLQALKLVPAGPPGPPATPVSLAIHKPGPFEPGTEQRLAVTAMLSDGSAPNYTAKAKWSSSNEALITFLPGGVAKVGYGSGPVTITASAPGGKPRDSIDVRVQAPLQDIVVTPKNPLVESGKTEPMYATARYADGSTGNVTPWVEWSSDKPRVADFPVNASGEWVAKAAGTAIVTAVDARTDIGGSTGVTVFAAGKAPKLTAIAIAPLNPEIKNGESVPFTATGTYADKSTHEITEKVKWESSHPTFLVIDEFSGVARPRLLSGNSLVRATDPATNLYRSTTVYVEFPGILRIDVTPKDVRIGKGDVTWLTVTATLRGGGQMEVNDLVQCTPVEEDVVEVVPGDTRVKGVAAGKTSVEVFEATSGSSQTIDVTVLPPALVDIVVIPIGERIRVGQTLEFAASGRLSDLTLQDLDKPTWRALTPDLIDVDSSGGVTGKKPGDAVVQVTDRVTGISGTVEVTVVP